MCIIYLQNLCKLLFVSFFLCDNHETQIELFQTDNNNTKRSIVLDRFVV